MALASCRNDNQISVLAIDGTTVEDTKRDLAAGLRPVGLEIAPNGAFAIVGTHPWRRGLYGRAQRPQNRALRVPQAEVCIRTCASDV
jgi:hypothetical protein